MQQSVENVTTSVNQRFSSQASATPNVKGTIAAIMIIRFVVEALFEAEARNVESFIEKLRSFEGLGLPFRCKSPAHPLFFHAPET